METMSGFVSSKTGEQNLLPTACARLIYNGMECVVRVLLDGRKTFLRTSVCDSLGMKETRARQPP